MELRAEIHNVSFCNYPTFINDIIRFYVLKTHADLRKWKDDTLNGVNYSTSDNLTGNRNSIVNSEKSNTSSASFQESNIPHDK